MNIEEGESLVSKTGQVRASNLEHHVRELCGFTRHSDENLASHAAAAEYVRSQLRAAGCEVESQDFEITRSDWPRKGLNIIGRLGPDAGPAILLGAHYDSVKGSPGADDNASGVAVLLECARILGLQRVEVPVIFAAFDAEEKQPVDALHGSSTYVSRVQPGEVREAIILEMLGYTTGPGGQHIPRSLKIAFPGMARDVSRRQHTGDFLVTLANRKSRYLAKALREAAAGSGGKFRVLPLDIPWWMPVLRNFRRSDHAPFWNAGIPAVMLGDTANFRNPHYHRATDTPDTLDYDFMRFGCESVLKAVDARMRDLGAWS